MCCSYSILYYYHYYTIILIIVFPYCSVNCKCHLQGRGRFMCTLEKVVCTKICQENKQHRHYQLKKQSFLSPRSNFQDVLQSPSDICFILPLLLCFHRLPLASHANQGKKMQFGHSQPGASASLSLNEKQFCQEEKNTLILHLNPKRMNSTALLLFISSTDSLHYEFCHPLTGVMLGATSCSGKI